MRNCDLDPIVFKGILVNKDRIIPIFINLLSTLYIEIQFVQSTVYEKEKKNLCLP